MDAAEKYRAFIEGQGLDPVRSRVAADRYASFRVQYDEFRRVVKTALPARLALPMLPREHLLRYCRRVYRCWRRTPADLLSAALAAEGAQWVGDWATPEQVALAAQVAMTALGATFGDVERDALAGVIAKQVKERATAGQQRAATGMQNEGNEEEHMVGDDFRTQAGDTVETQSAEVGKQGRRRGTRPARADSLTTASVAEVETIVDTHRRRIAAKNLRLALAGHQPIVKRVVAKRLCEHAKFDDIAKEYDLTRAEVEDILNRMRKWVYRFTAFFNEDYYWKETGEKYIIPEH
jgi:hypothetical protein